MVFQGYCFECEYEGQFKNKHICPKCKSEDIEIYEDELEDEEEDEFYNGEENDDDFEEEENE
ncbi:hypothetical protein KA977_08035 [Candidatus Dependentiae bacterium]|nr:hypothetical protein [Candidatus Dependentiae bacterium]